MSSYLEKFNQCPICSSVSLKPALRVTYWKENELCFFDCETCEATFANPMPSNELITRGNNALVRYFNRNRSEEQEFREARQAYLRGKLMAQKLRAWKKKGRLLELGCFQGFFALGLQDNSDWEVEGLEISSELCDFVNQQLGIKCHLGTLEDAQLTENCYDFVVCHDLIEHVNQPRKFLIQLSNTLAQGGRVQIITPNSLQDLAFLRRAHAKGLKFPIVLNHIMYFAPTTLKLALESVGIFPRKLYCYDIRHTFRDFGWFGLGEPKEVPIVPSISEALTFPEKKMLSFWTQEKLSQLKHHRKTSTTYGFLKEILPKTFTLHIPHNLGIGHEIYALGEKR